MYTSITSISNAETLFEPERKRSNKNKKYHYATEKAHTTRGSSVHIYPHMNVRILASNRRRAQRRQFYLGVEVHHDCPLVKGAYLATAWSF